MDNMLTVSVTPDHHVVYFTSDNVKQSKVVKQMSHYNGKTAFYIEPGETVIIPVNAQKVVNSLVVNVAENAQKSLLISFPQYADDTVESVMLKNHSRERVPVFDGDIIAELIPLTKQRGATK